MVNESSKFQRIVIFSPNWLGDAVMALPAIADVRRAHPHASLAVAARAAVGPVFEATTGVNEVIPLAGRGGRSSVLSWLPNSRALAAERFDLAILLPNSVAVAWLAKRAGIPERWGYRADWRGSLLTRQVDRPAKALHQVAYYQELVRALGIPNGPIASTLRARDEDVLRARDLLARSTIAPQHPVVAVAPGAAYGHAKRWLPERFADVINRLVGQTPAAVVLVGSRGDADSGAAVLAALAPRREGGRTVDLIGQTDLPLLMGVLSRCRLLISNDSGAMHLAAALGVPVTAVFGSTDEHATGPVAWNGQMMDHAVLTHDVWCRPCLFRECPIDHRCMTGIRSDAVFQAAQRLLNRPSSAPAGN